MLSLLMLLFSGNCDSLSSEIYNFSRRLKEVEFCKCMSRDDFLDNVKLPRNFSNYIEECPDDSIRLFDITKRYNKLKKELK
jgi:hypothetical protein